MSTTFVLSGGASLGAVQVGMLQALAEREIAPDAVIGTSVGALNAGFVAGHPFDPEHLETLAGTWAHLSAREVFAVDPLATARAFLGTRSALCSPRRLAELIDEHLTFAAVEEASVPLTVVATDFLTGTEVALSSGDAHTAILASCAIPAVFPPVTIDDRVLVDGALANNSAVSLAVDSGADTIYVLPSGYSCDLREVPRSPWGAAAHALTILIHQRLLLDLERLGDLTHVVVLPPPCPITVSPASFGSASRLIRDAHASAARALDQSPSSLRSQGHAIGFHTHH